MKIFSLLLRQFKPFALRKTKIVYTIGLSECSRVRCDLIKDID